MSLSHFRDEKSKGQGRAYILVEETHSRPNKQIHIMLQVIRAMVKNIAGEGNKGGLSEGSI